MIQWRVLKPLRFVEGRLHVRVDGEMQPAETLPYEDLIQVFSRYQHSQDFADELGSLAQLIEESMREMLELDDPDPMKVDDLESRFVLDTTPHLDPWVPWAWRAKEAVELDEQAYRAMEADAEECGMTGGSNDKVSGE